jgi:hypothetical protein
MRYRLRTLSTCVWIVAVSVFGANPAAHGEDSFEGKLKVEPSGLPVSPPGSSYFYDTAADESRWGDLALRFVYDGKPPPVAKFVLGGGAVMDSERLLVNAADGGLANVVVWLYRTPGQPPLRVHPSYADTGKDELTIATKGKAFVPHVASVRTTQTVKISNPDPHGYNVKGELFNNDPFNNLIPAGGSVDLKFRFPETSPIRLDDSIHSWMSGYLLVRDDPYAAISDKSGKLRLKKLPVGRWTFVVWHERGRVRKAILSGKEVELERGRVTLEIKPGDNSLGEVKLSPDNFRK